MTAETIIPAEQLPDWVQEAISEYKLALERQAAESARAEAIEKAATESRVRAFVSRVLHRDPDFDEYDGCYVTIDGLKFRWWSYAIPEYAWHEEHIKPIGPCSKCGREKAEGMQITDLYGIGAFFSKPDYRCPRNTGCNDFRSADAYRETATDRLLNALREVVCDIVMEERP